MFHCYHSPSKNPLRSRRTLRRSDSLLSLVRTRSSYSVVLAPELIAARDLTTQGRPSWKLKRKLLFKYRSMEVEEIEHGQRGRFVRRSMSVDIPTLWRSLPEIEIPLSRHAGNSANVPKRAIKNQEPCKSVSSPCSVQVVSPSLMNDDTAKKSAKVQDNVPALGDLDTEEEKVKSRKRKRRRQEKLLCCMRAGDDE